jgi:hypothetical protein
MNIFLLYLVLHYDRGGNEGLPRWAPAICRGIGKQRAFGVRVGRFILRDGEAMHLRLKEPVPG